MNDAVMIAMSGGVDSAVAAHLISQNAKSAAGITMRHFKDCPDADARDAATLCGKLGIPHFIADLQKEFERPWYGQLMQLPQTIVYLLQINFWLEHYSVQIR